MPSGVEELSFKFKGAQFLTAPKNYRPPHKMNILLRKCQSCHFALQNSHGVPRVQEDICRQPRGKKRPGKIVKPDLGSFTKMNVHIYNFQAPINIIAAPLSLPPPDHPFLEVLLPKTLIFHKPLPYFSEKCHGHLNFNTQIVKM